MKKRRVKSRLGESPKRKRKVKIHKQIKTYLTDDKLKTFKKFLIARKQFLVGTLSQMGEKTLSKSRREAAGDLSNVPIHIADMASDAYEQDFALGLMESEGEEIHDIDIALERIENKTYGLCERCSKAISEQRLRAIPYARLCIKCKKEEESGGKPR